MSSDRLEVSVTFDAERGYIASAPELRQPVTALEPGRSAPPDRDRAAARQRPRRAAARRSRRARTPPPTGAGAARTALPKWAQRVVEEGRALLKEAKVGRPMTNCRLVMIAVLALALLPSSQRGRNSSTRSAPPQGPVSR